ncbi:MAG: hypothetical protein JNL58_14060 [Planctomyces sp.]|nr:hypothetical protein [Planctomyces sp.]
MTELVPPVPAVSGSCLLSSTALVMSRSGGEDSGSVLLRARARAFPRNTISPMKPFIPAAVKIAPVTPLTGMMSHGVTIAPKAAPSVFMA